MSVPAPRAAPTRGAIGGRFRRGRAPRRTSTLRRLRGELAQRFIDDDRDGVGEIQAAHVRACDRDAVELGLELVADRRRQAAGLAAEYEDVVREEADLRID